MRLGFSASGLQALPHVETARPTFADGGNSRFRVVQGSNRAAEFAKEGWGSTIHLRKLVEPGYSETTGVSERVSSSLPLVDLQELRVDFLGDVTEDRGVTPGKDDHDAFAVLAEQGYTAHHIRAKLLEELARVT